MAKPISKLSKKEVKASKSSSKGAPPKKDSKLPVKKGVEKKLDKHAVKTGGSKSITKAPLKPASVKTPPNKSASVKSNPKKEEDRNESKKTGSTKSVLKTALKNVAAKVVSAASSGVGFKKTVGKKNHSTKTPEMKPPVTKVAPVIAAPTSKVSTSKIPIPTKSGVPKESKEKTPEVAPVTLRSPKTPPKKKGTTPSKKEEFELEVDLVGDGDDYATDELSEYKADLENAEEELEEKEVPLEEIPVVVAPVAPKEKSDDVILTDAEGRRYCRVKDCDQVATVDGYCRFHYLLLWKKIQVRKKILTDGKLERYVEELTSRYPDKFLEVIRRDLRTEKDFVSAIQEMEIDESAGDNEFDDESSNFIDEVRGASPEGIVEDDEY